MKLKNKAVIIELGAINFICAIFHIVFQFDLLAEKGIYREFLLTENMLITVIFLYFAGVLWFGQTEQKKMVIKMSMIFWAAFLLLVFSIEPKVTSLSIIQNLLLFPQNYYLLLLGGCAFALSFVSYRQSRVLI